MKEIELLTIPAIVCLIPFMYFLNTNFDLG